MRRKKIAIKFCYKAGMSVANTIKMIKKTYGDTALNRSNIFRWYARFWEEKEAVKDDERSGRPTTTRIDNVTAIDKLLRKDRRITSWMVAEILGIPKTVVLHILHKDLNKQKVCARLVPHFLTQEQRNEQVTACQDLLDMIKKKCVCRNWKSRQC